MTITEFLKTDTTARIDCGASWMFWEALSCGWVVLTRKYNAKKTKLLYRGESEEDAIAALWKEENQE